MLGTTESYQADTMKTSAHRQATLPLYSSVLLAVLFNDAVSYRDYTASVTDG